MTIGAVSTRAQELADQGAAFVVATVVRAQRPTSVKAGDVALVLGDGTIEGFVGGVCTQQSVRAYSLKALETGQALLLRILPEGSFGEHGGGEIVETPDEEGAVTVKNTCLSGGGIEVFLEPVLPAPRVLVVGDTPIAGAIVALGSQLGLDVVVVEGGSPEPEAPDLAVLVASHGRDELHILRRGLELGIPYVGLVASRKRGVGVLVNPPRRRRHRRRARSHRRACGPRPRCADSARDRALDPRERRRDEAGEGRRGHDADAVPLIATLDGDGATSPTLAIDPICGMTVAAVAGTPSVEIDGETVYFCCEGCKSTFEAQREHAVAAD